MSHYTSPKGDSDTRLTPLERLLTDRYGDLHRVIPRLATELGSPAAAAAALDLGNGTPSASFVQQWLRANGYVRRACYVKDGAE